MSVESVTCGPGCSEGHTYEPGCVNAPAPLEVPAPPVPIMAGTFALYPADDGGLVLVTDTPERGTERKHVPGALVKMAMGGGGMAGNMMRKLMGGG